MIVNSSPQQFDMIGREDPRGARMVTVLISSVGRRSQLVECFREAFHELAIPGRVIGTDVDPERAPAAHLVDKCYRVPHCSSPVFVEELLRIGQTEGVRLIIPTIDPELAVFATARRRFLRQDISVAISDPTTIKIACDKNETNQWLLDNGFSTVCQDTPARVLANRSKWPFPLIAKPRFGSASTGVMKITSPSQLEELAGKQSEYIVQELAHGVEYTINVFVENGRCVCAVPHRRIEARGGEVSKGLTSRNANLIKLATAIADKLPGARGALNVQCFVDSDGNTKVIEINARFGGGFPLANRAGAKFPRWMLESLLCRRSTATGEWEDNLLMLRYDSAIFVGKRTTLR
jgi:carbamoyl-phosphate synthase large subunit